MPKTVLIQLSLYLLFFGIVGCASPRECPEIMRLSRLGAREVLQHHYGGGDNLNIVVHTFAYTPATESYAVDLRIDWSDPDGGLYWAEGRLQSGKETPLTWTEKGVSRNLQTSTF